MKKTGEAQILKLIVFTGGFQFAPKRVVSINLNKKPNPTGENQIGFKRLPEH